MNSARGKRFGVVGLVSAILLGLLANVGAAAAPSKPKLVQKKFVRIQSGASILNVMSFR